MTASGRRPRLSVNGVACLLVVAALGYSYATYIRLPLTRPASTDYDEATAYIRARFQAGDLIDANPFWAVRVREYLGDLSLASFRNLEREDLARYRRVWLFSLFGAERRERITRAMGDKGLLLEERQFGRINVRLYQVLGHEEVRYDFRDRLVSAHVFIQSRERRQECQVWEQGRWRCSRAPWNYVGREILEIDGDPRAVIWAHPVSAGALTIEFQDVPMGRAIVVGAGFTPAAAGYGGAAVELAVEADGRPLLRRSYGPRSGFALERIDTAHLGATPRRVTFRVTTPDERVRHFCFSAETRG